MKKFLITVMALCFMLAALVGCGGGGNANKETTLTVYYENVLNPASGSGDAIISTFGGLISSGSTANVSEQVLTAYEHTKYVVEGMKAKGYDVVYEDGGWGEPLRTKQTNALLTGVGPDVFIGEGQMPEFAQQGYLRPFPDDLAQFVRENCYPAAYESMEFDGKIYGVAVSPAPSMLIINKELAYKIWGEDYKAPTTWDEWIQQMEEVTEWSASSGNDTGKNVMPGGPFFGTNYGSYLRTNNFFNQVGASFYDEETLAPTFETDKVTQVLTFFQQIKAANSGGNMSTSQEGIDTKFIANEIVFKIDHAGMVYYHEEQFNQEVIVAPYPKPTADTPDANMLIATTFFGVPTYVNDSKAEVGFDYIRLCLDEGAQTPIRDLGFKCAALKSVVSDDLFEKFPYMEYSYQVVAQNNVLSIPVFPYDNSKCWAEVGKAIRASVTSGESIASILSSAQDQLELYYENYQNSLK